MRNPEKHVFGHVVLAVRRRANLFRMRREFRHLDNSRRNDVLTQLLGQSASRLGAIVAAVVALFCFGNAVAEASTAISGGGIPASGTDAITLSPVSTRAADGNTFIDFTYVESWQGTFDGTRVGSGSLVIHPDGSVNAQVSGIFTGTIAGRSGTAVMRFTVTGTFASATAIGSVTDGTGGLAGVHAVVTDAGSATSPTSFAATYSGEVHFSSP
jgi:hypothetical protein